MSVFNATRLLNKTVLITGASSGIGAVSQFIAFTKPDKLTVHMHEGYCSTLCQGRTAPISPLFFFS